MIYITGDMHGDFSRFHTPQIRKLKKGDTLIVTGDFGFLWDDSFEEQKILKILGKKKFNICFVDGAHENFKLLDQMEVSTWNGGKVHHFSGGLYHLMRGQIYNIEGKSIFTMGGGVSPDKDIRDESNPLNRPPSPQEFIEAAQNIESFGGKVDYIITHEPTMRIKNFLELRNPNVDEKTGLLNAFLEELSDNCEFKKWYFGSLHIDKSISKSMVSVFTRVLNAETSENILHR